MNLTLQSTQMGYDVAGNPNVSEVILFHPDDQKELQPRVGFTISTQGYQQLCDASISTSFKAGPGGLGNSIAAGQLMWGQGMNMTHFLNNDAELPKALEALGFDDNSKAQILAYSQADPQQVNAALRQAIASDPMPDGVGIVRLLTNAQIAHGSVESVNKPHVVLAR